jgi:hypothetical protein
VFFDVGNVVTLFGVLLYFLVLQFLVESKIASFIREISIWRLVYIEGEVYLHLILVDGVKIRLV